MRKVGNDTEFGNKQEYSRR